MRKSHRNYSKGKQTYPTVNDCNRSIEIGSRAIPWQWRRRATRLLSYDGRLCCSACVTASRPRRIRSSFALDMANLLSPVQVNAQGLTRRTACELGPRYILYVCLHVHISYKLNSLLKRSPVGYRLVYWLRSKWLKKMRFRAPRSALWGLPQGLT